MAFLLAAGESCGGDAVSITLSGEALKIFNKAVADSVKEAMDVVVEDLLRKGPVVGVLRPMGFERRAAPVDPYSASREWDRRNAAMTVNPEAAERLEWYQGARLDDTRKVCGKTYNVVKIDNDGTIYWGYGTGAKAEVACPRPPAPEVPVWEFDGSDEANFDIVGSRTILGRGTDYGTSSGTGGITFGGQVLPLPPAGGVTLRIDENGVMYWKEVPKPQGQAFRGSIRFPGASLTGSVNDVTVYRSCLDKQPPLPHLPLPADPKGGSEHVMGPSELAHEYVRASVSGAAYSHLAHGVQDDGQHYVKIYTPAPDGFYSKHITRGPATMGDWTRLGMSYADAVRRNAWGT
jgi:hypothetical protein